MKLIKLLRNSHKNKIFYLKMRTTMLVLISQQQHLGILLRPKDSFSNKNKLGRITLPHRQLIISPFRQTKKLPWMVRIWIAHKTQPATAAKSSQKTILKKKLPLQNKNPNKIRHLLSNNSINKKNLRIDYSYFARFWGQLIHLIYLAFCDFSLKIYLLSFKFVCEFNFLLTHL